MRRPMLLVFLLFCTVGIAVGLAFAWLVVPAQPAGDTPERLNPADREVYVHLVAESFAANGDREAAARRLYRLGPSADNLLAEMIARDLTSDRPAPNAETLVTLAAELGIDTPVVNLLARPVSIPPATSPAPANQEAEVEPAPPLSESRYELDRQEALCVPDSDANRIELQVTDSDGRPQSGVLVTVFWDGGRDSFFTGFTPGQDDGYADYIMTAEIPYSVAIEDDEVSAGGLELQLCADGRAGGWRLEYRAREP